SRPDLGHVGVKAITLATIRGHPGPSGEVLGAVRAGHLDVDGGVRTDVPKPVWVLGCAALGRDDNIVVTLAPMNEWRCDVPSSRGALGGHKQEMVPKGPHITPALGAELVDHPLIELCCGHDLTLRS